MNRHATTELGIYFTWHSLAKSLVFLFFCSFTYFLCLASVIWDYANYSTQHQRRIQIETLYNAGITQGMVIVKRTNIPKAYIVPSFNSY